MVAPSDEPRDPETGRLAELAERRARRAAETGLIDRAERAERTAGALERRLDEAEGRLEVAQRERTALSASLEQAQRELTAALQREFAEQRMRVEQEGDTTGALADLEAEITRLGADHDAAEARAAALARALENARHEVDTAKARADAERQALAVDESRDGLRHELGELQALAEELHGSLLDERAARTEAERALASERERAEAEVTLLQYELDRRAQVHEAVSGQIAELRAALDAVRDRAERTDELEQAIATLEGEQRRTSDRLADTRELLGAREAELIAVEDRLVAREAELEVLRDEAEGHRAARREAEEGVASVHARAAELERELEEERRRRERVEERLEAERRRYASAAQGLRGELETTRDASDERLAAVQRTVDALRAELAAAATELDERVAAERTARLAVESELEQVRRARGVADDVRLAEAEALARRLEAVESELADTQAAATRERTRAEQLAAAAEQGGSRPALERARVEPAEATRDDIAEAVRAEMAAELAVHVERKERVEDALDALRDELDQAQADGRDRAEREAAVEALVGELVETAHGLRAGFAQELETMAAARDADLARERAEFAAELSDMERRVGELRRQLMRAADQLREELAEERSARWVAEAELAREVADRALAEERTEQAIDALSAAGGANPIYDVPPAGPLVPSADHPALTRTAAPAEEPAVVDDLARAMDRLRGGAGAAAAFPGSEGGRAPALADPEEPEGAWRAESTDQEPAAEVGLPPAQEGQSPSPAVETEPELPAAAPVSEPEPVPPLVEERVPPAEPRVAVQAPPPPPSFAPSGPGGLGDMPVPARSAPRAPSAPPTRAPVASEWLSARLAVFARTDQAAAERVLLSSLAAQATSVTRDVAYELELPAGGRYRVEVARGDGVSVAPVDAEHPQEVDFRLEGDAGSLAPLAGGAAPRRLASVTVRGRRRRLRRLLKSLAAPVGLAGLRAAGAQPPADDLLAMLCDGVPADAVLGADFAVAYDVTDSGGARRRTLVRARPDGRLGVDGVGTREPDAVVAADGLTLLAVLDGSAAVPVEGDRRAADTLHRWLRAVQGL